MSPGNIIAILVWVNYILYVYTITKSPDDTTFLKTWHHCLNNPSTELSCEQQEAGPQVESFEVFTQRKVS